MSDTIIVNGLRVELEDATYVCDFNVFFEVVNPRDDIYTSDGQPATDRGQDEVNFMLAQMTEMVMLSPHFGQVEDQPTKARLEEACLDWCRDDAEMHIEAFKQFKGHK
jgi:hypothetical protein